MGWAVLTIVMLAGLGAADPELERIVRDLGADDYQVRRAASEEIGSDKRYTLDLIEEALRRSDLSAEQRQRLNDAAYTGFVNSPHGALGVQFDTSFTDRLVVDHVLENFPAAAQLKPRDVIVEVDGQPIPGRVDQWGYSPVRPLVISHRPGEEVTMKVLRGGEKVDLKVALGDFNDLRPNGPIMPQELAESWRVRQRRTGLAGGAPIDAGLSADKAFPSSGMDLRSFEMGIRQRARYGATPSVVAGGRPDGSRIGDLSAVTMDLGAVQVVGANMFVPRGMAVGAIDMGFGGEKFESLQKRRTELIRNITVYTQIVNDPNTDKATATMMRQALEESYRQSILIDRELKKRAGKDQDPPVVAPIGPIAPIGPGGAVKNPK